MKKILLLSGLVLSFAFTATAMADTMTVVSDTSVFVYGPINQYAAVDSDDWGTSASAVITWKHPSWPTISETNWISSAYYTELTRPDSWRLFSDVIEIPSCATNITGSLSVTSDNAEEVYLNEVLLGTDGEVQDVSHDDQEWNTVLNYPLIGLQAGTNTLKIIVRNYAYSTDSPTVNPTGLIYKAIVNYTMDDDCDGIINSEDMCSGTIADVPLEKLGINRWIWGGDAWQTEKSKGKGPMFLPTMEQTYGCSCFQMLSWLNGNYPDEYGEMNGHYKFGCSTSIIEDFISLLLN